MNEHNFKIGDKVKVSKTSRWTQRIGDTLGVVVSMQGSSICVKWETSGCILCGIKNECNMQIQEWHHSPSDIYKINVKGEQLLFSFMKGEQK